MTNEEKAKAYDEALKVANKYKDTNIMFPSIKDEMFPELKESEDERIKNEIINFIKANTITYSKRSCEIQMRWIAWLKQRGEKIEPIDGFNTEFERQVSHLIASSINKDYEYTAGYVKWVADALLNYAKQEIEKQGEQKLPIEKLPSEMKTIGESLGFTTQEDCDRYNQMVTDHIMSDDKGEQNPADKVEPKFKVGDWIISDETHEDWRICKITKVENGNYTIESIYGYKGYNTFVTFEKSYHLWTIQDAKEGDILIYGEEKRPFIFKGLIDKLHPGCPVVYCGIDTIDNFIIASGKSWWTDEEVQPATKEQRDLLFQKMEENGWEWDAYKKELKLIEPFN